jgi:hypothetical protein
MNFCRLSRLDSVDVRSDDVATLESELRRQQRGEWGDELYWGGLLDFDLVCNWDIVAICHRQNSVNCLCKWS